MSQRNTIKQFKPVSLKQNPLTDIYFQDFHAGTTRGTQKYACTFFGRGCIIFLKNLLDIYRKQISESLSQTDTDFHLNTKKKICYQLIVLFSHLTHNNSDTADSTIARFYKDISP